MEDDYTQVPIPDLPINDSEQSELLHNVAPISERENYLREKQKLSVAQALENLECGWKVGIYRNRPTYVQVGYIETIQYDENNPIDLDYIKEEHGGGTYTLKFMDERGRIQFAKTEQISGKPREYGMIIEHPAFLAAQEKRLEQQQLSAQPQNINEVLLTTLLQNSSNTNQENLKLARDMAKNATPTSPQAQLKEMVGMMSMMRELNGDAGGGGSMDDMAPMIGQVLELLKNSKQQTNIVQPVSLRGRSKRAKTRAPQQQQEIAGLVKTATPATENKPNPPQPAPQAAPSPSDIAKILADSDVEKTAAIIEQAVNQMPPEKFMKLGSMLGLGATASDDFEDDGNEHENDNNES